MDVSPSIFCRSEPDAPGRAAAAAEIAGIILGCLHCEFPNKEERPRLTTPVFYGCFDWHSAVHSHWALVRLMRCFPRARWHAACEAALCQSLQKSGIDAEVRHLATRDSSYEMPYGLCWLLTLCAELARWQDGQTRHWQTTLEPLEELCWQRVRSWLETLEHPDRSGQHRQTAFSLGLLWDWAQVRRTDLEPRLRDKICSLYQGDGEAPLSEQPSGFDFLSPPLAQADLMRRVLPAADFRGWFSTFFPTLATQWLSPAPVIDRENGKTVHIDGLNLSRAWMLYGLAAAVAPERVSVRLRDMAADHGVVGFDGVSDAHYAGAHWLGSFAVYLLTLPDLPESTAYATCAKSRRSDHC